MAEESALKNQLAQITQLLRESKKLQQETRLQKAIEKLHEAKHIAEEWDEESPETFEATAAVHLELALLQQRLQDPRGALQHYLEAERFSRKLPLDSTPRHRFQLATALINMTGLYAQQRMVAEGVAKAESALQVLEPVTEGQDGTTARMLRMGAQQNLASLHIETREFAAAERALTGALSTGADLVGQGVAQLLPQVIDISGRLVGVIRAQKRIADAMPIAERAARWAEAAYESGGPQALGMYIATQLQLVDLNANLEKFAQAETHLWKAVEVANEGRTLTAATGFYFTLLHMTDERLASGDLPREEVLSSLSELMDKLPETEIPAEVVEFIRARYSLLVDEDSSAAESIVARYSGQAAAAGPLAGLLPALRADVDWVRKGRQLIGAPVAPGGAGGTDGSV